jgi:hypothetical protein
VRLEKITDNTYVLKTNIIFDREENSFYSFTLFIYDHGQPKNSIENLFELHLIDVNDCSPYFDTKTNYSFNINENNKENLILYTIKTFDLDEDDSITIKLIYSNNEEQYKNIFKLNQQNQLIILVSLDYEQEKFYQFCIQAEDKIGHKTLIPIFIYVNDLNDNPVQFLTNFTRYQIEENQNIRIFIDHIQAKDKDINDQIIYSIYFEDFQQIKDFIELNINGSLYTKKSFDREQINKFHFRIIANDSLHTDLIVIEINIIDQNDNKPILISQSPLCFIFNQTNINQTIEIQLEGYDPDEYENGNISFSLRNPSSNNLILLSNGMLIIQPIFQEYTFDIYLNDHGKSKILSSIYENFLLLIVYNEYECRNYSIISSIQLDQQTLIYFISIILICLACFTIIILIICCCFYFQRSQQQIEIKSLNNKSTNNFIPSFSSSLNDDAENDTLLLSSPSPQFTAMTTVSTSTTNDSTRLTTFIDRHPTNKSSSLSSSSSSTYVKMSRSFEEEML